MTRLIHVAALTICCAAPLHAQSLILGAGYADFQYERSEDQTVLFLEYQHRPLWERGRFSARLAGAVTLHGNGDFHLGAGVAAEYAFDRNWFIEASVLPGFYFEGEDGNTLGSHFEVRSLLGVGYRFMNGNALSLAATHKSNASVSEFNPGVNSVLLRFHRSF
ncbi:acyloxyacyl hydrolase [Ruegeria marina]|uniref:Lipid A 3-O-deacylase (PagL) n=1 Tax=Ruegeria marina TaxID=639004 RepID=A0A1G7CHJ1_9RHOB|nr:acyloxyacyl hydrolase [Ruegeria marina]SDE38721.1 Lipid A 3-O-deacylase (PagL) [Ruegeria marina]